MNATTIPEPVWVIEMQGPAYLGARHSGGYDFYWTEKFEDAIWFKLREHADTTMMAIRQLRGDLFPACLTQVARAVEHCYIAGKGWQGGWRPWKGAE